MLVVLPYDTPPLPQLWCRALHMMTTYLMLTTYSWMLCEGAYLRVILVGRGAWVHLCLLKKLR